MSEVQAAAPAATEAPATTESVATEKVETKTETTEAPKQEAAPSSKKKYKIKVDGEEIEEEIDLSDENAIKRHLQMSKAAQKRMQEAALTRKQAEQFIQALQNDPMSILTNDKIMGEKKFREIAEAFLVKQLEQEMLSPEQRAQKEMERKLREYEEREKAAKEREEQERMAQLEQHYAEQYQKVIIGALEESRLPKNEFTVRRMAELMQKNLKHGLDLEPSQLAHLVREDYVKELNAIIGGADAEAILGMFGDDVAKKIRKYDIERLRAGSVKPKVEQKAAPVEERPKRPMTRDEWRAELERRVRE